MYMYREILERKGCISMKIEDKIKNIIDESGRSQLWIVEKMNTLQPNLSMNKDKLSSIVRGKRKMTADELLIFCMALEISPDRLCDQES